MNERNRDWQGGLTPRQRMTRQIINSVRTTAEKEHLSGPRLISTIEATVASFFKDMPQATAQRSEK